MQPITIIGGGIGGLCLAIGLQQRQIPVQIYEAAPVLRPVGAGILLAPNAMNLLERWGLAEAVRQRGLCLSALGGSEFGIVDAQGRSLLPGFDLKLMRERFGQELLTISRAALQQTLLEALPADCVQLGKRLVGLQQTAEAVEAKFADGSTIQTACLIGADGLRSAVREQIFPKQRLRYSGQTSHRALVQLDYRELGQSVAAEIWGQQLRFGYTPVGQDLVYWYATSLAAQGQRDASPAAARETLLAQGHDLPAIAKMLIERTSDEALLRTDISDLSHLKTWYQGRIGLLGDAAHATTPNLGQGGCQAIEDAWVLAEMLARYEQPQLAFLHYQKRRMPKAQAIVDTSWRVGSLVHLSHSWQQQLRNRILRLIPRSLGQRQTNFIYALNF
ncbi:FAD-dependent monooxygenase [Herpetosiphon giganteus]|uniref:FAD-dependent monooxygenase n=1 Tax=Herpetosiphon giganteus TaxID=2029754 RepID=UPI00195B8D65|nr:FAD-dependent monooxygenase [Herpetosiphon giganteus]MBM7846503.1 2-polyprenyl-6-methoxyphenol hydroxylase-like FAD-dependent oxidoreductase [Herpetosiphon giganteus]